MRSLLLVPFLALVPVAGCGPALVATPPAAEPSVRPAPVPVPRADTPAPASRVRFTLPGTLPATDYVVRVRTTLERDSAGRTEQDDVESSARVQLLLRRDVRGSLRGSGRVDSFVVRAAGASVRSAGGTVPPPAPAMSGVMIDATLDSAFVRASVRPALANECDRPEAAAASMARELLVRIPQAVAVGDRWRDSLVSFVCRSGVPITMRMNVETTVERAEAGDGRLRLRRATALRLDGITRSPWRQVEITGEGRGTQTVIVDVARGTVLELDGESTLTFRVANGSLRDAARTQQVVQKSAVQVRVARP